MKKFKAFAAAAAFACASPAFAAAAQDAPQETTSAQKAEKLCAEMAADKDTAITCTAEQKAQLTALIDRVIAMPVTDRYSSFAQQYALFEGMRQIFFPNEAPLPLPPKDKFEEGMMQVCASKLQQTGVGCSAEQQTKLTDFLRRLDGMAEPTDVEGIQARQQFIRDEMTKIFPELGQGAQSAPSNGANQLLRRMNLG